VIGIPATGNVGVEPAIPRLFVVASGVDAEQLLSANAEFRKVPRKKGRSRMIRLIAVAGFALVVATSAQAMTSAPIPQRDGIVMQVRLGCGPGRTRVNGVCVARTSARPAEPFAGVCDGKEAFALCTGERH
jgi:hypothetical protein